MAAAHEHASNDASRTACVADACAGPQALKWLVSVSAHPHVSDQRGPNRSHGRRAGEVLLKLKDVTSSLAITQAAVQRA